MTASIVDREAPSVPYLSIESLFVQFYDADGPAVDDVTLGVAAGDMCALLGPSGAGKTTLLRAVAGFERPRSGRIRVGGETVVDDARCQPPERRRIGYLFQDIALFPHLSVADNVTFGLRNGDRAERDGICLELLRLLDLSSYGDRAPHTLSIGQQQRVAIARALAPRPSLLLMDEPFASLDTALRHDVRARVREITRRQGITVLIVTHDREEALSFADRIAVLRDGRLVGAGSPTELYYQPESEFVARVLGECTIVAGHADDRIATCALGNVPLARSASGPSMIMLRPEALQLVPPELSPVSGHVEDSQFVGGSHVWRVNVDGTSVVVRASGPGTPTSGDRVGVRVVGTGVSVETL